VAVDGAAEKEVPLSLSFYVFIIIDLRRASRREFLSSYQIEILFQSIPFDLFSTSLCAFRSVPQSLEEFYPTHAIIGWSLWQMVPSRTALVSWLKQFFISDLEVLHHSREVPLILSPHGDFSKNFVLDRRLCPRSSLNIWLRYGVMLPAFLLAWFPDDDCDEPLTEDEGFHGDVKGVHKIVVRLTYWHRNQEKKLLLLMIGMMRENYCNLLWLWILVLKTLKKDLKKMHMD
jgi:hypothetical protein